MRALNSKPDFVPLLKALQRRQVQIEMRGETNILVATKIRADFFQQELAPHNTVTLRELIGPRVPVRGRRRIDQVQLVEARWPNDCLHEITMPALNFILEGWADIRVSDYSIRSRAGDIILIPAGLPRSDGTRPDYVDITPSSTCDILQFSPGLILGSGLECGIRHSRKDKHIAGSIDERCWVKNLRIAQLYSMLNDELLTRGNTKSTFLLLLLLLIELQQEIKAGKAMVGWPFSTMEKSPSGHSIIGKAKQYIDNHLDDNLTIKVVAHEVGVSRTVLTSKFREETEETFKEYLINKRIELAKRLLRDANLPVQRVAEQVGLSPRRLRGIFNERFHCSPDKFRKREI